MDAAVIGAGFSGLYAIYRLRAAGFSVRGFETGREVGGTWFWNRYPGARCDVESLDYSYSFDPDLEQDWTWTERFATQPEILRYLRHVADRYDLRPLISFNTRVTAARWDEDSGFWDIATDDGSRRRARFLILATGALSAAKHPDIDGLNTFQGQVLSTSNWPEEGVSFAGKRVGVVGTGSSAIQAIPILAEAAAHLTVFQRTPAFSLPARNAPLSAEHQERFKANYSQHRAAARATSAGVCFPATGKGAFEVSAAERERIYEAFWEQGGPGLVNVFKDLLLAQDANDTAAEFVRSKIRSLVHDEATAQALCPRDYPIGSKRVPVDTGYYETFNRTNVRLKDIRDTPIERVTPAGVLTTDGETQLDVLVLAVGFDAMTGSFTRIDIRGRGGLSLRDKWAAGPQTYLGVMAHGFPNMFLVTGPGSPSVLSNMVLSGEQHVEWIVACLDGMRQRAQTRIEATDEAEADWVAHVNAIASTTLYMSGNSWYLGANVPGKPRVFMPYLGGVARYRAICDRIARDNYKGFMLHA